VNRDPALEVPILARRLWLAELGGRRALACALAAELNRILLQLSGWEPEEETTDVAIPVQWEGERAA
jgi:hypothetical protein